MKTRDEKIAKIKSIVKEMRKDVAGLGLLQILLNDVFSENLEEKTENLQELFWNKLTPTVEEIELHFQGQNKQVLGARWACDLIMERIVKLDKIKQ